MGILLIIGSLVMGYFGYNKVASSGASVEVLGIEIDASNKSSQEQGYLLMGLGLAVFVGGIYVSGKK